MATHIFKSALIGAVLAIAFELLAHALALFSDATAIYVYAAPGIIFPPLIHWIDSYRSPGVGVSDLLLYATIFWTIFFGAAHFGWSSLRRRAALAALHLPTLEEGNEGNSD